MKMSKTNCLLVSYIDKKLNLCFLLVILGKEIIVQGVGVGKLYGKAPSEWKGGDLTSWSTSEGKSDISVCIKIQKG